MAIKTIFFDVDGTLVDPKTSSIAQSTIWTLQQLQKDGYRLCIASGRSYENIKDMEVAKVIVWDGYICCNGQQVVLKDGTFLQNQTCSKQIVNEVLAIANQLNHPICMITDKEWFLSVPADQNTIQAMQFLHIPLPKVEIYHNQKVYAFICFADVGYDYAPYQQIKEIKAIPSYSSYADVVLKSASKAKAIQKYLQHFQLEGYIAFGDSMNDYEMLQQADIAIAMGQGSEKIKQIADEITTAVDEDGILYAYEHFECFLR
ncbi:MAG: HAD family hydrolase [Erysipelotrichaceae bacterium]|nr:HAD family hydrolase [Erysipelotrichaceae bacterium]